MPLAVWAFRMLPPERSGGLVSTRREALPVPEELLGEVEAALSELSLCGVQGAPRPLTDRFRRLENRCRDEGLVCFEREVRADRETAPIHPGLLGVQSAA